MAKQKYYTVWKGQNPGVYTSWEECQQQVKNYEGAIYKSFDTKEEAEKAYGSSPYIYVGQNAKKESAPSLQDVPTNRTDTVLPLPLDVQAEALAVDAACSGNPGKMEYRGVYLRTGQEVFHFGPVYGTNNIGEFLAIVHALALLKAKGYNIPIYSDSHTAIAWVKQKKCKTKLPRDQKTEELFSMILRAENWLKNNTYSTTVIKWETEKWGEVPADFGRK